MDLKRISCYCLILLFLVTVFPYGVYAVNADDIKGFRPSNDDVVNSYVVVNWNPNMNIVDSVVAEFSRGPKADRDKRYDVILDVWEDSWTDNGKYNGNHFKKGAVLGVGVNKVTIRIKFHQKWLYGTYHFSVPYKIGNL